MISLEEARDILKTHAASLGYETVPLKIALGTVLAEPVVSPFDVPGFDNSAVDGFGIYVQDVQTASIDAPAMLNLVGTVPAGESCKFDIPVGSAVKILTGAPIPPGIDAVVMQEFTEVENGTVSLMRSAKPGENIRFRGEEFKAGATVLEAGIRVTPPVLGLLATLGYSDISVFRKPKIAVIVTGSELIPPGRPLAPGQIYESNSYSLAAALKTFSLPDVTVSHVGDDPVQTRQELQNALDAADVIITTGGVSVGEFDLVKDIFADLGVQQGFWQVAIKPGKPVFFGTCPAGISGLPKYVFGLPGNPVAVLVTFECLVKPFLLEMMGHHNLTELNFQAELTRPLKKKPGRLELVRGILFTDASGKLLVTPSTGQGSHMLSGMVHANSLIHFPADLSALAAGETVAVSLLDWSMEG